MPRSEFICTYENCSAKFRHKDRYERHLRKHTGERPFKCTFDGCDKAYSCSSHLKRHEATHEIMFKCTLPGCSQILKTKQTLMKHQDVFHNKKEAAKKYKCSECNEEFTKRCMLVRHSYVHTGVHAYKCSEPDCDKSFPMPSLLKRHMKRHKGYFCEESGCSEYFPRWSSLCKHKRECHIKIFRCHMCEKVFKHACNLKSHSLTHKLEKDVFRCTVPKCIRVYASKHSLADHMRNFHEAFTIPCPEGNCHRFLRTKEALQKHIQWRHKRRENKKPPPKRPDFAEILSGFAKGTKIELNPHLSKKKCDDDTGGFETVCLDSSDATEEGDKEQTQDEELTDEISGNETNEELSEVEVIILHSPDVAQSGENSQCYENSNQGLKVHPPIKDDLHDNIQSSKPRLKDIAVEIEVVSHSSQNCVQSDGDECLGGENYCFSCKTEADQMWTSPDMPISKVK